jgi:serine protease Do
MRDNNGVLRGVVAADVAGHKAGFQARPSLVRLGLIGMISLTVALSPVQGKADVGDTPDASRAKSTLAGLQDAFSSIADEVEPAVVTVSSTKTAKTPAEGEPNDLPTRFSPLSRPRRSTGTGTGVIIRKEGWILTNDHVVGGADRVTIKMHDGREFVGTVLRDYKSDLALIKVESPTPLPTARLGDSDKVKIGHWAVAIGSPYRYEGSLSVGVISSLYRQQHIRDTETVGGGRLYPNMIQTDAAINPGNSGGPLCNLDGEIIGINTAIESEGGGSIGIGFAIPINSAKFVIDQLLAKGKVSYGQLGVHPQDITPRSAIAFNVTHGAWIDEEPLTDSPAGKAGLHVGDVITAINGKSIQGELDLRNTVAHTPPNSIIEITYVRSGKEMKLKATLDEATSRENTPDKTRQPAKSKLGIEVQPLTDRLAKSAGVASDTNGVIIKSIDSGTSAGDVEDMTQGCVILRINDKDTTNLQVYKDIVSGLKSGDQVRILFLNPRGKYLRIITVD